MCMAGSHIILCYYQQISTNVSIILLAVNIIAQILMVATAARVEVDTHSQQIVTTA